MRTKYWALKILLSALLVVPLGACQKKTDADQVADAQNCLDHTDAAGALGCMDKVAGVSSEAADLVRCSSIFIFESFGSPVRISSIATQMQNSGGSATAGSVAIGLLVFASGSGSLTALQMAQKAFDYCAASKSKGMMLLASMAVIATVINSVGGATIAADCDSTAPGYSAATCQASVQTSVCSADTNTLGSTAISAYQQSCSGSSQQNSSVCKQYQTVTNGSTDPATVGGNLKHNMENGGGGGC